MGRFRWYCSVCEMGLDSRLSLDNHIFGLKHRQAIEKAGLNSYEDGIDDVLEGNVYKNRVVQLIRSDFIYMYDVPDDLDINQTLLPFSDSVVQCIFVENPANKRAALFILMNVMQEDRWMAVLNALNEVARAKVVYLQTSLTGSSPHYMERMKYILLYDMPHQEEVTKAVFEMLPIGRHDFYQFSSPGFSERSACFVFIRREENRAAVLMSLQNSIAASGEQSIGINYLWVENGQPIRYCVGKGEGRKILDPLADYGFEDTKYSILDESASFIVYDDDVQRKRQVESELATSAQKQTKLNNDVFPVQTSNKVQLAPGLESQNQQVDHSVLLPPQHIQHQPGMVQHQNQAYQQNMTNSMQQYQQPIPFGIINPKAYNYLQQMPEKSMSNSVPFYSAPPPLMSNLTQFNQQAQPLTSPTNTTKSNQLNKSERPNLVPLSQIKQQQQNNQKITPSVTVKKDQLSSTSTSSSWARCKQIWKDSEGPAPTQRQLKYDIAKKFTLRYSGVRYWILKPFKSTLTREQIENYLRGLIDFDCILVHMFNFTRSVPAKMVIITEKMPPAPNVMHKKIVALNKAKEIREMTMKNFAFECRRAEQDDLERNLSVGRAWWCPLNETMGQQLESQFLFVGDISPSYLSIASLLTYLLTYIPRLRSVYIPSKEANTDRVSLDYAIIRFDKFSDCKEAYFYLKENSANTGLATSFVCQMEYVDIDGVITIPAHNLAQWYVLDSDSKSRIEDPTAKPFICTCHSGPSVFYLSPIYRQLAELVDCIRASINAPNATLKSIKEAAVKRIRESIR